MPINLAASRVVSAPIAGLTLGIEAGVGMNAMVFESFGIEIVKIFYLFYSIEINIFISVNGLKIGKNSLSEKIYCRSKSLNAHLEGLNRIYCS
jgi:hypothetical protein